MICLLCDASKDTKQIVWHFCFELEIIFLKPFELPLLMDSSGLLSL